MCFSLFSMIIRKNCSRRTNDDIGHPWGNAEDFPIVGIADYQDIIELSILGLKIHMISV
jgi:hypothetical protein